MADYFDGHCRDSPGPRMVKYIARSKLWGRTRPRMLVSVPRRNNLS